MTTALAASLDPMRWWDIAEVVPLESRLFTSDAWTAAQFWSELARVPETRWYVVARHEGRVVGYAGLFEAGRQAQVQTVAVAPHAQGHGLGRLLVGALIVGARERGASVLQLEVRADNASARAVYDGLGFVPDGLRRDYYGRGQDAVLMSLPLRAATGSHVAMTGSARVPGGPDA